MKKPKSDNKPFGFEAFREEAMARLTAGDRIGGPDGIMAPLLKKFFQANIADEMEAHLEEGEAVNRRNGKVVRSRSLPHFRAERASLPYPTQNNSQFPSLFGIFTATQNQSP